MTYTAIATYTTGQLITATIANEQWGGNISHVASMKAQNGTALSGLTAGVQISAPVTTAGDIGYYTGSAWQRLGIGANGTVLGVSAGNLAYVNQGIGNYVQLRNSANTAVGISATVILSWDTENEDTAAYHETGTNPSRITIPSGKAGRYLVYYKVIGTKAGAVSTSVLKNGGAVDFNGDMNRNNTSGSTYNNSLSGSLILNLIETDYIELQVTEFNGSAMNILGGVTGSLFGAILLG